jgi:D-ribose pyranose/furanose isomerase RbsD
MTSASLSKAEIIVQSKTHDVLCRLAADKEFKVRRCGATGNFKNTALGANEKPK